MMRAFVAIASLSLLSAAGCSLNTAPPAVAASPAPVVIQQPAAPAPGSVVVTPRSY